MNAASFLPSATLNTAFKFATVLVCFLCLSLTAAAQDELPGLTKYQLDFINVPANLSLFGLTKEKLVERLRGQGPEAVRGAVTAMMETLEKRPYMPSTPIERDIAEPLEPAGDYAEIPMNTEAGRYNSGKTLRPAILDEFAREPGIFSVKRYLGETDGIPTFANAPVAVRLEDLVASRVDVAFVGVPLNLGSGWRDAQHAPGALRAMHGLSGYDVYAGVDPALELTLADYGDISVDRLSIDMSVDHVRETVSAMVEAGVVPFLIGGDHSVMYPAVAAMSDIMGVHDITVVHLDAHPNAMRGLAHPLVDQNAVSALIEDNLMKGSNLVQLGLRGRDLNDEVLSWLRSQDVRYHTMAEVEERGWDRVMKAALSEAKAGPGKVFISFDMSVLDPAEGPGAGRPVSAGLTMREVLPFLRRLCAETQVVGFGILDVNPYLDLSYQTPLNANSVMHACLSGIALQKTGITKDGYLSDMTRRD
jgi:agmatinase